MLCSVLQVEGVALKFKSCNFQPCQNSSGLMGYTQQKNCEQRLRVGRKRANK